MTDDEIRLARRLAKAMAARHPEDARTIRNALIPVYGEDRPRTEEMEFAFNRCTFPRGSKVYSLADSLFRSMRAHSFPFRKNPKEVTRKAAAKSSKAASKAPKSRKTAAPKAARKSFWGW